VVKEYLFTLVARTVSRRIYNIYVCGASWNSEHLQVSMRENSCGWSATWLYRALGCHQNGRQNL